jgi:hypothetical protein
MGEPCSCSRDMTGFFPAGTIKPLDRFALQGIHNEQTIFSLVLSRTRAGE